MKEKKGFQRPKISRKLLRGISSGLIRLGFIIDGVLIFCLSVYGKELLEVSSGSLRAADIASRHFLCLSEEAAT